MVGKITSLVVLICIIISMVSIMLVVSVEINTAEESYLEHNLDIVKAASGVMDSYFSEITNSVKFIAEAPLAKNYLNQDMDGFSLMTDEIREASVRKIDEAWSKTINDDSELVRRYTENELAEYLKKQHMMSPDWLGEIFITDRFGNLVASTGRTETFSNADEYWWMVSYNEGRGMIFLDDRGFDESVDGHVFGFAVPIYNQNKLIGILKSNIRIESIVDGVFDNFKKIAEPAELFLVRSDGEIIIRENQEPYSGHMNRDYLENLSKAEFSGVFKTDGLNTIISHSVVKLTRGDDSFKFGNMESGIEEIMENRNETWNFVVMMPLDQIPGTGRIYKKYVVYGMIGTIFIGLIAFILSYLITRPFRKLLLATDELADGNLDVKVDIRGSDEIKKLADSFNQMTGRLKHTLASRDQLEAEIEKRKRAEEEKNILENEIREHKKLESMGILAGGVAHEINNPLNGIMNYGQLIFDDSPKGSEAAEYAGEIINETNRISSIVRSLLQYSRRERAGKTVSDIRSIVEGTATLIRTLIKRDNIELEISIEENLPKIPCNSQQIQQVVMNLLTNARDSLNDKFPNYDPNKKIMVNVGKVVKNSRTFIQLSIRDNGLGIEDDIHDKIFSPFFTTKGRTEGTGMGLAISYSIVKDHSGELYFDTLAGEYTEFFLLLPV